MAGTLSGLWRGMRPRHWVKNVFVLAPLVFARKFPDPEANLKTAVAFVVFCILSSAVYLLNDLADREADRHHPRKKNRPVASGQLRPVYAWSAAMILAVVGLAGSMWLAPGFVLAAAVYLGVNLAYSLWLKRVVILDVMLVASGFLIRAWAGAEALDVRMSHWLVLCTGLVALFIGFVKRRQEMVDLESKAPRQRSSLESYSVPFLDQMISVVTSATLLGYALYAFSPDVASKLGTRYMGATFPFVLFGMFRYLFLVHQKGEGDNPTAVVLSDRPLLLTVLAWGALVILLLYQAGA